MQNTELKIGEGLAGLPTIDYRNLNAFQGDFKQLGDVEYTKLKLNLFGDGVIPQQDFFIPIMVWFEPKSKKPYILDGHQRINVIKSCGGTPYALPYLEVKAKNKIEAKKKLALINSQYGKITRDGWEGFMYNVDIDFVRAFTTLEAFTLPPLDFGFGGNTGGAVDNATNSNYQSNEEVDVNKIFNDVDEIADYEQKNKITLAYNEEDYTKVMNALKRHQGSKEQIFYQLIGADKE
jgi:hypothetical protein